MDSWHEFYQRVEVSRVDEWVRRLVILNEQNCDVVIVFGLFILVIALSVTAITIARRSHDRSGDDVRANIVRLSSDHSFVTLFVSFIAFLFFGFASRNIETLPNVLKTLSVTEIWELSPQGVSSLLAYVRYVSGVGAGFLVASTLGLTTFWVKIKVPPAFRLQFLTLFETNTPKWRLFVVDENDQKAEWGRESSSIRQFKGKALFLELAHDKKEILVRSRAPSPEATHTLIKLDYIEGSLQGRLVYNHRDEMGFGPEGPLSPITPGKRFWILSDQKDSKYVSFRLPETDAERGRGRSASVLVLLMASVILLCVRPALLASAAASHPAITARQSAQASCMHFQDHLDGEPIAELVSRSSADASQDGTWFITGQIELDRPAMLEGGDFHLYADVGKGPEEVPLIDLQYLPPLQVKFLFDLDRDAIYEASVSNPLCPDVVDGVAAEEAFWDQLITDILDLYGFDGKVGDSDVGTVYATWKCASREPGAPLYVELPERWQESAFKDLLFERMKMVVAECLAQADGCQESSDVSQKVYDAGLVQELSRDWSLDDQQLLVIIRWCKSDSPIAYQVLSSGASSSQMIILDISREQTQDHPLQGATFVEIIAPSKARLYPDVQLEDYHGLRLQAERERSHVRFLARFPDDLPLNRAGEATLTVKYMQGENVVCQSDAARLHWSASHSPSARTTPIYIRFGLPIVSLLLCTQLLIAGVVAGTYVNESFRDRVDRFADYVHGESPASRRDA